MWTTARSSRCGWRTSTSWPPTSEIARASARIHRTCSSRPSCSTRAACRPTARPTSWPSRTRPSAETWSWPTSSSTTSSRSPVGRQGRTLGGRPPRVWRGHEDDRAVARRRRRDPDRLRAYGADRGGRARDAAEGGGGGQGGEQCARPVRADQRAPPHEEHGRVREQGDDAVLPRLPQRHRRHLDEPQQPAGRGHGRCQARGLLHGQRQRRRRATFKTDRAGPSFDIGVRIEELDVTKLNDLFRAYGRFDSSAGRFDLYSELDAKDAVVTGYVKPLFKDLKIYDKQQDKSKPLVRKMYERLVSGVATLLKNRSREELATKAEVLGRI